MSIQSVYLNFPRYKFRITEKDEKEFIFDPVRKKHVRLTPEEWVRQHVIQFLILEKNIPALLIRVESVIQLLKTKKRIDVAVFDRNGNALLVVECKAPAVTLTQNELDQAVRYNMALKVKYLLLTNGLVHIYCQAEPETGKICKIEGFPDFAELSKM